MQDNVFQLPPSDKNYLSALWGKLASEILMQDWDTALDDLNRIKEVIDNNMINVSVLLCFRKVTGTSVHKYIDKFYSKNSILFIIVTLYVSHYYVNIPSCVGMCMFTHITPKMTICNHKTDCLWGL